MVGKEEVFKFGYIEGSVINVHLSVGQEGVSSFHLSSGRVKKESLVSISVVGYMRGVFNVRKRGSDLVSI